MKIQDMTDIMPTSDTCDRNIRLYEGNAYLFHQRAIQDFYKFKELENQKITTSMFSDIIAIFDPEEIK